MTKICSYWCTDVFCIPFQKMDGYFFLLYISCQPKHHLRFQPTKKLTWPVVSSPVLMVQGSWVHGMVRRHLRWCWYINKPNGSTSSALLGSFIHKLQRRPVKKQRNKRIGMTWASSNTHDLQHFLFGGKNLELQKAWYSSKCLLGNFRNSLAQIFSI